MERAVQASAVVEHAAQCNRPLHPKVLCYGSNLHLRRIKEAMYIRHNTTYNRDRGADISDLWSNIIIRSKCCSISEKQGLTLEKDEGLVYMVKCACSAAYIGETSGALEHRLNEHMKCMKWYNNAKSTLQNGAPVTNRGRPPKLNPQVAMEKALKASAVAEHIALCNNSFQAQTLCYESNLRLRKIKEALYIRYNTTFNRDLGEDVSMIWANLIDTTNCCSLP
ncbi:hypothetical protein M514_24319 [Trichuris suis]|uniref:GIY-YIG domain-containing protein n=1 Tax=Trichuris suis TaxID=68888 RepID=A0A085N214_9BILA|nr:hypothetical protein M514_24319 [Trichuris suis]